MLYMDEIKGSHQSILFKTDQFSSRKRKVTKTCLKFLKINPKF